MLRMEAKMNKITVNYEEKPCYSIYLDQSFEALKEVFTLLDASDRKVCIVTDSTVEKLYLQEVVMRLKSCAKEVISYTFPAGEKSKTLDVIYDIYETLITARFDRKDLLVALGGGVVGDMTGYAAATYLRGIRFVQIPTTLLSMVDSSIGGKTGVDYKAYKNMIGAFHQPSAVYMNLSVLSTLTKDQYTSGMGEIVKHALIKDKTYYEWLKTHRDEIMELEPTILLDMIRQSLVIKKGVVERDPKERGERAMLNFGHTLGHAIEKRMNFTMLHGDCVAVGALAASYISYKRGYLSEAQLHDVKAILEAFSLPVSLPVMDTEEIIEITQSDKKMEAGQIQFILIEDLGKAFIDTTVTKEEMREALEFVMQ